MTDHVPELLLTGITKTFSTPAGDLNILSGVDLSMRTGDAVAIVGPSGSGKSTLLYIIGLLDTPSSGSMVIHREEPLQFSPAQQAQYRSSRMGFIFQDHHLLPQCTVLENVLLPAMAAGGIGDAQQARARRLLERVGLRDRMDHAPSQLSGGERQRVAVCRALINEPGLLLADEPTGNLDRRTAETIGTLLLEMAQEEQTMLICVTHSQELAARMPRCCELVDGKLIDVGKTATAPAG